VPSYLEKGTVSKGLVFTAMKWLVCGNHPADKTGFTLRTMDEKGLHGLLTTTGFIFRCKFGLSFSFQMILVHSLMVPPNMPDQHASAVIF
jgi:hypothetical protein